jgi:hypothetical protein
MKNRALLLIIFFCLCSVAISQVAVKKELRASRISERPKIDGFLTDECWRISDTAGDFVQY